MPYLRKYPRQCNRGDEGSVQDRRVEVTAGVTCWLVGAATLALLQQQVLGPQTELQIFRRWRTEHRMVGTGGRGQQLLELMLGGVIGRTLLQSQGD